MPKHREIDDPFDAIEKATIADAIASLELLQEQCSKRGERQEAMGVHLAIRELRKRYDVNPLTRETP